LLDKKEAKSSEKVARCVGTSQTKYSTNLSIERPAYFFSL